MLGLKAVVSLVSSPLFKYFTKGKEKVDEFSYMPYSSIGHNYVDADSNSSKWSLDEDLDILAIKPCCVKKL